MNETNLQATHSILVAIQQTLPAYPKIPECRKVQPELKIGMWSQIWSSQGTLAGVCDPKNGPAQAPQPDLSTNSA
ncbi:hypothetical protein HZ326_29547 [Fusarium oxysporum f. sp. albedinis]|nr:hypothetical protein HZ326_29547 [Fusarium oxysporum f. sp. albedinis]